MTSLAKNTEVSFGYNVLKNIRQVYAVSDYKVSISSHSQNQYGRHSVAQGYDFWNPKMLKYVYFSTFFLTDAQHFIIWKLNIIVSNYIALKFIS